MKKISKKRYPKFNRSGGFRSGLENLIAKALMRLNINHTYERHVIPYVIPEKTHRYTPDFVLLDNGIVIESKGEFDLKDRQKHIYIKDQHPLIDLRFVFTNSRAKIRKNSPTSYGIWATKNGFKYADKEIPAEWLKEAPNQQSMDAMKYLVKI